MLLTDLGLSNFRNIASLDMHFSPGLNLIIGENGAGKTSLLESIYYAVHGKSFRAAKQALLLSNSVDEFIIRARFCKDLEIDTVSNDLGIIFHRRDGRSISYNQNKKVSLAAVAADIPMLYIGADSHFAWQNSSKCRRSHLDWGVFHVEHGFFKRWREFNALLQQYNSGLKANMPESQLSKWREQLAIAGEEVHAMRASYIKSLRPAFTSLASDLGELQNMDLDYYAGWDCALGLLNSLEASQPKDRVLGHSQVGAQRADINFVQAERAVKDELSQGQMKLALYALKLAQAKVLQAVQPEKRPIYLIDDMPSELDLPKQQQIIELCSCADNQVFMTAINKMIHVKHHATEFELQSGNLVLG